MKHLRLFENWSVNESLNKDIKAFGQDLDNEYYTEISWDDKKYDPIRGENHPIWNFHKRDVKRLVSHFNDWDLYLSPHFLKDRWKLSILAKGTPLEWLCPNPNERKKIIGFDLSGNFPISEILITGNVMGKLYQVHIYDDDYYTCTIRDKWGNSNYFKCDQIDGVIQLLKDRGVV